MGTKFKGSEEQRIALDTFIKLNRCLSALGARIAKECPLPAGLTVSQFSVMEALLHCGPLSQQEVGHKILRSRGNITMVVDNLEKRGLVQRERDEDDRRVVVVSLTQAGRELISRIFPQHVTDIVAEMSILTVEEQETLGRLCRKLGKQENE